MPLVYGQKVRPHGAVHTASLSEREVLFVFAIIETGGKQYKVCEGDTIFVEKLDAEEESEVVFENVLALSANGDFKAGSPTIRGAKVTAKVLANGKGQPGTEITEFGALDQISEMYCEDMLVWHFDSDG